MTGREWFMFGSTALGGLALFLFGIRMMSDSLTRAAGRPLQRLLERTTARPANGLLLGSLIGLLVQSSAGTVLLVGFVHAGLMTLAETATLTFGINIGATLSMQLLSFKLADYALAGIAVGFAGSLLWPHPRGRAAWRGVMGFGLLFLGMRLMSDAAAPQKELLAPLLAHVDGATLRGTLTGIAVAAGITGILQSSGAVIGMVFAMISAGVITDLRGAYPVIIGANIGTCVTALLGSIGTNIDARRSAISHLLFNLWSAGLAVLTAPLFYGLIPLTSGDLVHQAANANTLKMVATALALLPFARLHIRIVTFLTPSRKQAPESSHLDETLLDKPEQVVTALIQELRRAARICLQSMHYNAEWMSHRRGMLVRKIKKNEESIDKIKASVRDYVRDATHRYLSKRQSILLQHLERCMADIERIGDHIDAMADLSVRRKDEPAAQFDEALMREWGRLFEAAAHVLEPVIDSLDPEIEHFQKVARNILKARDEYMDIGMEVKSTLTERMEDKQIPPLTGIYFNDYIASFDKIVKHARAIALAEQQPQFWIKRKKLHCVTETAEPDDIPREEGLDEDFLDRLQKEGYL